MSITSTYRAFARLKQTVHCSGIIQTWVGSENVETYQSGVVRLVAVLSMTSEFLQYQKEAVYSHGDVKIWEDIAYPELPLRSLVIKSDNSIYRINELNNRGFEGGFRTYLAKKIENLP